MSARTELNKALTTTGDGEALKPYDLDPVLFEELCKLQPLAELLNVIEAGAKTHEYTLRTSHPQGWFEGETTPANAKNSVYQRKTVQLKIQRIWGSVTGFAQVMDKAFADAFAVELEGSLEGLANSLEYAAIWAASDELGFTGDAYQNSGIVPILAARAPQNVVDAAGAKVTLDMMDQAIAKLTAFRGVSGDPKLWLMGLRMKQIVDGLQTRVNIPLTSTVLQEGKMTMANYGGSPIYETDYLVPADSTTSPACTGVIATGGSLPNATYLYRIASVSMFGEQVAGTASANVVSGTTDHTANLSWTADSNAKLYMIFRKDGSAAYKLLDVIPALTYAADGTVNGAVATYVDAGTKTPVAQFAPLETGEQNILLINRNPRRGVAFLGKVDDMGRQVNNLFTLVELARVKDTYDYMIKGYLGLRAVYPNVAAAMIRRVKTA